MPILTPDHHDTVLSRWMEPAIVVGMLSVAFATGVYVGRSDTRQEVVRLETELQNHRQLAAHPGALPASEVRILLQSIEQRLVRIESKIQ